METIIRDGRLLMLVMGIIQAIPTIIANLPKIIEAIVKVIEAFNWVQLGSKIIKLFANGIKGMISFVRNIAKDMAEIRKNAPDIFEKKAYFDMEIDVKDVSIELAEEISKMDACEILSKVGLCAKEYINREINNSLSGGELKRIEIATRMVNTTTQLSLMLNVGHLSNPNHPKKVQSMKSTTPSFLKRRSIRFPSPPPTIPMIAQR